MGMDHEFLKGSRFFLNQTDLKVPQDVHVFRFNSMYSTLTLDRIS